MLLNQIDANMIDISETIDHLQATLEDLIQKRKGLTDFSYEQRSLVHPIRRIPPELLSKIFLMSLPPLDVFEHSGPGPTAATNAAKAYNKAATLPGRVSGYWRTVSISTAGLWSYIDLDFSRKAACNIEMIKLWLARSKRSSLSIHLFLSFTYDRPFNFYFNVPMTISMSTEKYSFHPEFQDALNILVGHADRWQEAIIPFPLPNAFPINLLFDPSRLPRLRALSIPCALEHECMINTFSRTPRLREVQFQMGIAGLEKIELPWSFLTKLKIHDISAADCCDVLGKSPNLIECIFCLMKDPDPTPGRSIHHRSIERLSISCAKNCDVTSFIDTLTLPNLISFNFEQGWPYVWPQAEFIAMLKRSGCALDEFSLYWPWKGNQMVWNGLVGCLEYMPKLRSLCLDGGAVVGLTTAAMHRLMRPDDASSYLAPLLQTLDLLLTGGFDQLACVDMVESRLDVPASSKHHHGSLHRVNFKNRLYQFQVPTLERLGKLIDKGLHIGLVDEYDRAWEVEELKNHLIRGDSLVSPSPQI